MSNNLVTRQNLSLQAWIVPVSLSEIDEGITEGGIIYIEEGDNDEVLWYKTPSGTVIALGGETQSIEDHYVTGSTLEGTVLHIKQTNPLADVTVDLSSLQGGTGETSTLYSLSTSGHLTVNDLTSVPSSVHTQAITISVEKGYVIPTTNEASRWNAHTASIYALDSLRGHDWVGQDLRTNKEVQFAGLTLLGGKKATNFVWTITKPGNNAYVPSEKAVVDFVATEIAGVSGIGDNLGNHIAEQTLYMSGYDILQVQDISPNTVSQGTLSLPYQYWSIPTVTKTCRGDLIKLSCPSQPALFFGDIVCFSKSYGSGQPVSKAKANSTNTMPAIGMVKEADSNSVTILLRGLAINTISSTWNWDAGKPLYLSTTIEGTMTQYLESKSELPNDSYIQVMGVSISSQLIYFNPQLMYLDRTIIP